MSPFSLWLNSQLAFQIYQTQTAGGHCFPSHKSHTQSFSRSLPHVFIKHTHLGQIDWASVCMCVCGSSQIKRWGKCVCVCVCDPLTSFQIDRAHNPKHSEQQPRGGTYWAELWCDWCVWCVLIMSIYKRTNHSHRSLLTEAWDEIWPNFIYCGVQNLRTLGFFFSHFNLKMNRVVDFLIILSKEILYDVTWRNVSDSALFLGHNKQMWLFAKMARCSCSTEAQDALLDISNYAVK